MPTPTVPHGPIQIPGLGPQWYQETLAQYAYDTAPSRCPICGGVGIPWRGWFTCDDACQAIALVESGRTFLPVQVRKEAS
jgi:hypothetical protein